jgi:hypothetical protein
MTIKQLEQRFDELSKKLDELKTDVHRQLFRDRIFIGLLMAAVFGGDKIMDVLAWVAAHPAFAQTIATISL